MKHHAFFGRMAVALALAGCTSSSSPTRINAVPHPEAPLTPLLE